MIRRWRHINGTRPGDVWEFVGRVRSRSTEDVHVVERHPATGLLRCPCASFHYNRAEPPRCYHTDAIEQELEAEAAGGHPQPPADVLEEAIELARLVLKAAGVVVPSVRLVEAARVLVPRLANGPAVRPVDTSAEAALARVGERLIHID